MARSGLHYGAEARRLLREADQQRKIRELGGNRRFFLKPDTEAKVTFLDGELEREGDNKGFFRNPSRYEHMVFAVQGSPPDFYACTQEKEACPLCRAGHRVSLCTYFTVIDHSAYKGARKTYKNDKKLYVVGPTSLPRLRRLAERNGGTLRGLTVMISRSGDRSPRIGDGFDVLKKRTSDRLKLAVKKFWPEAKTSVPIPYDKVLVYFTAKRLKRMGVGRPAEKFSFEGRGPRGSKASRFV